MIYIYNKKGLEVLIFNIILFNRDTINERLYIQHYFKNQTDDQCRTKRV